MSDIYTTSQKRRHYTLLLHSSNWVCRWKNCENRSIFSKDMDKSIVSPFFDSRCIYHQICRQTDTSTDKDGRVKLVAHEPMNCLSLLSSTVIGLVIPYYFLRCLYITKASISGCLLSAQLCMFVHVFSVLWYLLQVVFFAVFYCYFDTMLDEPNNCLLW